jgi:hypothetical protein
MQNFSWMDVTVDHCCPKCLAVMEEQTALTREVRMQSGDIATVRFSCKKCDFVKIGKFDFEGHEASDLVDDHILEGIREAKSKDRALPVVQQFRKSQYSVIQKPTPKLSEPKEFKTDDEALAAVYPDAVSQDELLRAIETFFPEQIAYRDKSVDRQISPDKISIGDRGEMLGYVVSYALGEVEIFSNSYFSYDGIPKDIEADAQKPALALQSLVKGHTAALAPRQPRGFGGRAVHIPDMQSGETVEIVKSRGMPAAGEGVRG